MSFGYDPDRNIPDLSRKVILITGGTDGLGRQALLALSKHNPEHIFFTGSDAGKAQSVINAVEKTNAIFIQCDHASLMSIRKAASQFTSTSKRLDILICNAGVMAIPPSLTEEGYEVQFGINHLSHALLTKLILPTLERTAREQGDARVISIASLGASHTPSGGIEFDSLKTTQDNIGVTAKWMRYGQSKLANILYVSELAKRHPWLTTVSLEPGTVWTGLLSNLGWVDRMFLRAATWWKTVPLHEGAYNTCWAATVEKRRIESGKMYKPVGVKVEGIQYIDDDDLAGRLWVWTEKELEDYGLE